MKRKTLTFFIILFTSISLQASNWIEELDIEKGKYNPMEATLYGDPEENFDPETCYQKNCDHYYDNLLKQNFYESDSESDNDYDPDFEPFSDNEFSVQACFVFKQLLEDQKNERLKKEEKQRLLADDERDLKEEVGLKDIIRDLELKTSKRAQEKKRCRHLITKTKKWKKRKLGWPPIELRKIRKNKTKWMEI